MRECGVGHWMRECGDEGVWCGPLDEGRSVVMRECGVGHWMRECGGGSVVWATG